MKRILPIALALLALAGCGEAPELRGAFYMGQGEDARGTSHKGQAPVDLSRYQLVVWNPGVDLEMIREAAPSAVHLAYVDIRWVAHAWGSPSSIFGRERAAFDSSAYWQDDAGAIVEVWPGTWELLYTVENADRKAEFILEQLQEWDGIYLDDCHAALPTRYATQLQAASGRDVGAISADFLVYRDRLVEQLRAGRREGLKLVGNVGWGVWLPTISRLRLDGVCAEEWWPADRAAMVDAFRAYDRRLCVSWEWNAGLDALPGIVRYRARYDSIDVWPEGWPE